MNPPEKEKAVKRKTSNVMSEIIHIPTSKLRSNKGGLIEGLPKNPRQWTRDDVNRIANSLEETPELFELRPLLVYEVQGVYVILGGNLRFEGAKKIKLDSCPCIVLPADTTPEKMKEIVIKDNGQFGAWDYDELANGWDDLNLTGWGVKGVNFKVPEVENEKDFMDRFNKVTNETALCPIIPEYDEEAEVFLIVSRTKTDSNWLREKLGMQKMKSYKSDQTAKSNVISIEDLKNVL